MLDKCLTKSSSTWTHGLYTSTMLNWGMLHNTSTMLVKGTSIVQRNGSFIQIFIVVTLDMLTNHRKTRAPCTYDWSITHQQGKLWTRKPNANYHQIKLNRFSGDFLWLFMAYNPRNAEIPTRIQGSLPKWWSFNKQNRGKTTESCGWNPNKSIAIFTGASSWTPSAFQNRGVTDARIKHRNINQHSFS